MGGYVALLRGINVGGSHIIPMAELRSCFENMGFTRVRTHIQSGNVVFDSGRARKSSLVTRIEQLLSARFRYGSRVVVLSHRELERVVAQAPRGFGKDMSVYRYDVLYVKDPVTTGEVLAQLTTKPGVDEAHAGDHALYFRRLISKATQSRLARVTQLPVYQHITIRNWNTTTKLLEMSKEGSRP